MIKSFKLRLKVCDTKGTVIVAKISPLGNGTVNIDLPYIEAVSKDNALNCPSGKIHRTVTSGNYSNTIECFCDK